VARESFPETNRRNTPPRPSPAEEAAELYRGVSTNPADPERPGHSANVRGLEPRQPMHPAHGLGAAGGTRL
ncbi:MAG: hypothetical protein R6U98_01020, partial [Pirellulaceae bacterium]